MSVECWGPKYHGRCCCNCRYHLADYYSCSTVERASDEVKRHYQEIGCVCGIHKGWVCAAPESDRVHSDWDEHGMCELHTFKDQKGAA